MFVPKLGSWQFMSALLLEHGYLQRPEVKICRKLTGSDYLEVWELGIRVGKRGGQASQLYGHVFGM